MAKSNAKLAPGSLAADDKKWRAESDLRTLVEAKKIEADPQRLKAAKAEATRQHTALKAVVAKAGDEAEAE